jgi:alanine-synthesizing transaminase
LDDVKLVDYPLFYDYGWAIDVAELERRVTEKTRAIVVVHPNNPTGNFAGGEQRKAVEDLCRRHGLALIVDEVFLDYPLSESAASFAGGSNGVLSFVLSGLSKVCALPQMKLSWIVANGPQPELRDAMARLEVIADTFLSVSTPAQLSLPGWLAGREVIQQQIRERMRRNLEALQQAGLEPLKIEGGWTAVIRFSQWTHALQQGVIVQPGSFYGLGDGRSVLSLITPEEEFREGVRLLGNH